MRGTHFRFDRRAERSIYEDLRDCRFVAIVFVTRLSATDLITISWHVSRCADDTISYAGPGKVRNIVIEWLQQFTIVDIWSDETKALNEISLEKSISIIHNREEVRFKIQCLLFAFKATDWSPLPRRS